MVLKLNFIISPEELPNDSNYSHRRVSIASDIQMEED